MSTLQEKLNKLPEIKIFVEQHTEDILKELKQNFLQRQPHINLVESDTILMQLEDMAYRKALYSVALNNKIKQMLPHFCQGQDLDHFVFAFYGGEQRLQGEEPTAMYEFSLEEPLTQDIVIPKGLVLSDGNENSAFLMQSLTIVKGEQTIKGQVKLNIKTKQSDIATNIVTSPYPYVLKPKALSAFEGGSDKESDEEFFERAILSLYKYSTAGSQKAYEYFAKSADERIFDVKVFSPSPMHVDIYVLATNAIEEVVENVKKVHEQEKVQAFCDVVNVQAAVPKEVTIAPTVYLLDLLKTNETQEAILKNFESKFKIGEALPYSKVIKALEVSNVYEVELEKTSFEVQPNEYLKISVEPQFKKAVL